MVHMQNISTRTLLIALVVFVVIAAGLFSIMPRERSVNVTSFEECAAAGYPIMESYPEQCRTPDGRNFVRVIPPADDRLVPPTEEGLGLQANGCAVAGCSGQLCVSADEAGDIVTTCEYRSDYACYKEASCEKQADGQCGWTQAASLQACLQNPPPLDMGTMPQ
jgi:eight-cysteine-cluster-containing protein